VVSFVVFNELLDNLNIIQRDRLLDYLELLDYEVVRKTLEIESIANEILNNGILTQKSYNDCLHIACAMTSGCDCIVSYNFKHMVNIRTIKGIQAIAMLRGYGYINIITPGALLSKGD
jgi:predicted nucleic acid-binding protein